MKYDYQADLVGHAGEARSAAVRSGAAATERTVVPAFTGLFWPHLFGEFWPHPAIPRPGEKTGPEQGCPSFLAALETTTGGAKRDRTGGAREYRQRQ